jgi:hypothetical protein
MAKHVGHRQSRSAGDESRAAQWTYGRPVRASELAFEPSRFDPSAGRGRVSVVIMAAGRTDRAASGGHRRCGALSWFRQPILVTLSYG